MKATRVAEDELRFAKTERENFCTFSRLAWLLVEAGCLPVVCDAGWLGRFSLAFAARQKICTAKGATKARLC